MTTGTGSDEVHDGGGAGARGRSPDDLPGRVARGVVDGFTEASQAFSSGLESSKRLPEVMGRSVVAVLRANAWLLDEVAGALRQVAARWDEHPPPATGEDVDYERLADLVAARLERGGPVNGAGDGAVTGAGDAEVVRAVRSSPSGG
jgi:hypothetical protein